MTIATYPPLPLPQSCTLHPQPFILNLAQVFLCADLWKDACTLKSAYHDSAGVTEAFIRNGLHNALRTLGLSQESPDIAKWPYHVVVNPELQQVGSPAFSHHTLQTPWLAYRQIAEWPYYVVLNPELQQVGSPACCHHTPPLAWRHQRPHPWLPGHTAGKLRWT